MSELETAEDLLRRQRERQYMIKNEVDMVLWVAKQMLSFQGPVIVYEVIKAKLFGSHHLNSYAERRLIKKKWISL